MALALRHYESVESLYSDESDAGHAVMAPAKHALRHQPALHIQTPPKTHRRYQSEEEVPSPSTEEDYSEFSSRSEAENSQDEISIDPTIDLDALKVLHSAPYETAKRITILCSGQAAEIYIGRFHSRRQVGFQGRSESPIHRMPVPRRSSRRRQRSISLYDPSMASMEMVGSAFSITPTQASFDSSRSSSASRSRSSSVQRSITNFSAPHRNPARPRPSRLASTPAPRTSTDSMGGWMPSLSHSPESPADPELSHEDDESDAVMRESVDVQVRTRSAERERQMALSGADHAHYSDDEVEATPKMPTNYAPYDTYTLESSQLSGDAGRRSSAVARKWKGFTRMGRRGRRDATAGTNESGW